MNPDPQTYTTTRVGRLIVAHPEQLVLSGLNATYNFVAIRELRLDVQWRVSEEREAFAARISEVTERLAEAGTVISGDTLPLGADGHLRLLRYTPLEELDRVVWEGLAAWPGVALWLTSQGAVEHDADLRKGVEAAAGRWIPLVGPAALAEPPRGGFFTQFGAFPPPPALSEEVFATFTEGGRALTLTVEARRVVSAAPNPFKAFRDSLPAAPGLGVGVGVLREGPRTLAGMGGVEQAVSLSDGSRRSLAARWWFAGVGGAAPLPSIHLDLRQSTSLSEQLDENAFLTLWDEVLAGLALAP